LVPNNGHVHSGQALSSLADIVLDLLALFERSVEEEEEVSKLAFFLFLNKTCTNLKPAPEMAEK